MPPKRKKPPKKYQAVYAAIRRYRDAHRAQGLCIYCSRKSGGKPSSICAFHRRRARRLEKKRQSKRQRLR